MVEFNGKASREQHRDAWRLVMTCSAGVEVDAAAKCQSVSRDLADLPLVVMRDVYPRFYSGGFHLITGQLSTGDQKITTGKLPWYKRTLEPLAKIQTKPLPINSL
jgi:hypothetical protein